MELLVGAVAVKAKGYAPFRGVPVFIPSYGAFNFLNVFLERLGQMGLVVVIELVGTRFAGAPVPDPVRSRVILLQVIQNCLDRVPAGVDHSAFRYLTNCATETGLPVLVLFFKICNTAMVVRRVPVLVRFWSDIRTPPISSISDITKLTLSGFVLRT